MPAKNLFFIFLMCFISSLFSINTEAKSLFNSEGVIEAVNENYNTHNTIYAFALFHSDSTIPKIYRITEMSNGASNEMSQAVKYVAFRMDQNPMDEEFFSKNNWQCFPVHDHTPQQYFSETNLHSDPILIFSAKKPSTPPVPFPIIPVLFETEEMEPISSYKPTYIVPTDLKTSKDYISKTEDIHITFEKWSNNINNPIVKTDWIEKYFIPQFTNCNEYLGYGDPTINTMNTLHFSTELFDSFQEKELLLATPPEKVQIKIGKYDDSLFGDF